MMFWKQGAENTPEMIGMRYRIAQADMAQRIEMWRALLQMYKVGDRKALDTMSDDRDRLYHADQQMANVSSSIMFNAVETVAPRLMGNFDPEGWFTVQPLGETKIESAKYVEDKLKWQLEYEFDNELKINEVLLAAAKQCVKIGKSIICVKWGIDYGKNYMRIPIVKSDGSLGEKFIGKKGVTYRGPKARLVPWYNFFPDPKGKMNIKKCLYVIEETIASISDLEDGVKIGVYDKAAIEEVKDLYEYGKVGIDPVTEGDRTYASYDPYRKDVRMLNYYEDKRYVYEVVPWSGGNEGIVLNPKKQDNPYDHNTKPFVELAIDIDEDTLFPKGVLESLRDEQAIKTTFLNMAIDAGTMSLRPMRLVAKSLGIDLKDMQQFIPNKVIPVDDDPITNDMRRIQDKYMELKPDSSGYMTLLPLFLQMIDKEANDKSGVTAALSGQMGIGHTKTKGGIAQLTQTAEIRVSVDTQIMSQGATRLLEMMHSMNQQFGDISEPQYGEYDWKVFQNAAIDRGMRLATLQNTLPYIGMVGGNVVEALRRILKEGGVTAINSLLPADGSMDQNKQQQVQGQIMQMLMQQQGGGGAQQMG